MTHLNWGQLPLLLLQFQLLSLLLLLFLCLGFNDNLGIIRLRFLSNSIKNHPVCFLQVWWVDADFYLPRSSVSQIIFFDAMRTRDHGSISHHDYGIIYISFEVLRCILCERRSSLAVHFILGGRWYVYKYHDMMQTINVICQSGSGKASRWR